MKLYASTPLNCSNDEIEKYTPNIQEEFEKLVAERISNLKIGESLVIKDSLDTPVHFITRTQRSLATLDLTRKRR